MRPAIETIAIEMIVPADDLLLTALGSTDGVADAVDDAATDALGDFDAEGFGEVRTVLLGVGVGVGLRDGTPETITVPLIPGWIEQW